MADELGAVRRTPRPGPDEQQWHGVYLVQFSNRCQKVGYSHDPQGRVYDLARKARNFRVDVDSVQIRIVGTEAEAREVEQVLLVAFAKVAKAIESQEYFYGVQGQQGQRLFERVCATYERTRSGNPRHRATGEAAWASLKPRPQETVNGAPPVAAYGRSGAQTSEATQSCPQAVTDDLSAISGRGVVRTQKLLNDLIAEGWTPPGDDTGTEWSVRYSPTSYSLPTTEAHARKRLNDGIGLVCRTVGPWTEITE